MTIHLSTLGQIHLRDDAGVELRSLLTQPKRLALLVYLATVCADGRMCRRDSLLTMFWPDSDAERARNTLRQALHFIKQVAGADIFVTRGADELGIAAGTVALDTVILDALAAAGRHADVVMQYRGAFLEGFVLRGAPAFDQWVVDERERLRTHAVQSATLALPHLSTPDAHESAEHARALLASDVLARARVAPAANASALTERAHGRRTAAFMLGAAAMLLLAATVILRPVFARLGVDNDPNRLIVLPFVIRGPESLRYLADGLPILLDTRLDGAGTLHTVNERAVMLHLGDAHGGAPLDSDRARDAAARFGAQLYVLGSVVGTSERLRLSASLYDRARGRDPIAHADVDGPEGDLVKLVDRLTSELLAARFHGAGGEIAETAARTTTSLPALKAWLKGEAALRAGRYAPAMASLREAVAADDSFALAHFRLGVAASWLGLSNIAREEAEIAVAQSGRMSPSTRLVVRAFLDMQHGNYTSASAALRSVVAEQPSATEAWYELGDALFHGNPPQGRSLGESREAFETALRLDPRNFPAVLHLARIAAARGENARLDSLSKPALRWSPDDPQRSELILLRALALRDDQAREQFLALPTRLSLLDALWRASEYSQNLAGAAVIADSMVRAAPPGEVRGSLFLLLAHLSLGRERFDEASRHIDSLAAYAPQSAAVTRLLLAAHPAMPPPRAPAFLARALAGASPLPATVLARKLYVGASVADSVALYAEYATANAKLALGDSTLARRLVVGDSTRPAGRVAAGAMRLTLAGEARARAAALHDIVLLDSLAGATYIAQSAFSPRALQHLAVSRALEREGRLNDAYVRLLAVPEDFGFNIAFLAEVQRRRGVLLGRMGRAADAERARASVRNILR